MTRHLAGIFNMAQDGDKLAPIVKDRDLSPHEQFNEARILAGRGAVSPNWLIVTLHKGMKLACGCEVVTANGHDYTERHWRETCTLKSIKWQDGETQRKIKVGDGKHIAGTIVDEVGKVFASCDPSKGLWPHEL